jgi:hypothetical protein
MNPDVNALIVLVFCLVRCLVPVALLLGATYLLKRLGWLPAEPQDEDSAGVTGRTQ